MNQDVVRFFENFWKFMELEKSSCGLGDLLVQEKLIEAVENMDADEVRIWV